MTHLGLNSEITVYSASFCGTILPHADSALYGNEDVLEQIVLTFYPKAPYQCLLDAITAWLVPGLRSRVLAYYRGAGPPLRGLWPAERIELIDLALAKAIVACAEISTQLQQAKGDAKLMRALLRKLLRLH